MQKMKSLKTEIKD